MTPGIAKQRVAAIGFFLLLAFIIGLPLWRFQESKPSRFGWHMYSSVRVMPSFWLVLSNGDMREAPLSEVLSHYRADQRGYEETAAKALLRRHPDAVRVRVEWNEKTPSREFP